MSFASGISIPQRRAADLLDKIQTPFVNSFLNPVRLNHSKSIRNRAADLVRRTSLRAWICLIVCIGMGLSGCSMFNIDPKESKSDHLKQAFSKSNLIGGDSSGRPDHGTAESGVRLTGGLSLGDTDNLAFTPEALSRMLNELLEAERWNSLRRLIGLYPDIVTQILMGNEGGSLSSPQLIEVARLVDKQWGGTGNDTWHSFIVATNSDGQSSGFVRSRNQFMRILENGEPDKALDLRLVQSQNGKWPVIARAEAHRLEGVAHMMLEHHGKSVDHFAKAIALLKFGHPYQASKIALLLGESQRHVGDLDNWKSSWELAIDIQSRWLDLRGLKDPAFWKQAAFLRPASTAWPSEVIGRLENSLRNDNLDFGSNQTTDVEAVVWATIGTQSLKRHESQNAILALKKSEALVVANLSLKEELQMQQALAMIDGGQQGPASAILLRLGSKSSLLGDRAKAILATLKLQNGSLAQGMNLLQSAIKTSNQWPTSERLRAQADYGLSYLMLGREEEGIALLNQVNDEFVKHKSYGHAAQCLTNIATYYEKTDQRAKHRLAVARIKQLEIY